eukprot:1836797-Rhodomonas_salina.2
MCGHGTVTALCRTRVTGIMMVTARGAAASDSEERHVQLFASFDSRVRVTGVERALEGGAQAPSHSDHDPLRPLQSVSSSVRFALVKFRVGGERKVPNE